MRCGLGGREVSRSGWGELGRGSGGRGASGSGAGAAARSFRAGMEVGEGARSARWLGRAFGGVVPGSNGLLVVERFS